MFYGDLLLRRGGPEWWLTPTTIVGFRRLLGGFSPPFGRAGMPLDEVPLTWPLTPQPQVLPLKYEGGMRLPEPHSFEEC